MSPPQKKSTTDPTEVDRICMILSKEIYDGQRLPNEHLTEIKLTESFSVSRIVIREVLIKLESYGLVEIEPYKGAKVALFNIQRIQEEYEISAVLEGFAAQLAANRLKPSDINQLTDIIEKQKNASEDDMEARKALNRLFHSSIFNKCGNKKLVQTITQHVNFTNFWFFRLVVYGLNQSVTDHERILKALIKKDGKLARKCMEQHKMENSEKLIKQILTNIPLGVFEKRD